MEPIRTVAELDLEFAAFIAEPSQYQDYAEKVTALKFLGMNISEISRSLGLEPKTVKRALAWSKKNA